jgi:hypothetical protein
MADASMPQHRAPKLNTCNTWQLQCAAEGIAPNRTIAPVVKTRFSISESRKG